MKYGFVKVCAAVPDIKVADCVFNAQQIILNIEKAYDERAKVCVFPELCVTGYTCGDLFLQDSLLNGARTAISEIAAATQDMDIISIVGAPIQVGQALYNCAVILYCGSILAIVPKKNLPNYGEFYEKRHFVAGNSDVREIEFENETVPFGINIIIKDKTVQNFALAVEVCEDLWTVNPPSNEHALAGATVIANLSASNELVGKVRFRKDLVTMQSAKLVSGYIYSTAGFGESTTDMVYGGGCMICEGGKLLAEGNHFENGRIFTEIDVDKLVFERRRTGNFIPSTKSEYYIVETNFDFEETRLSREFKKMPFVPGNEKNHNLCMEEVLSIQANGLKKRLIHTGAKTAVIGISGGLDSTLALLVTARAFDLAGLDRKNIVAVTMPCFGTTERTYNNAVALSEVIGADFREINIKDAVLQHFKDIGHDENVFDVTFENSQARERTQVLMDIANKNGGIVIGTGDMSELALGWATYNGDHMSMYGVNAGVPKTLIRFLVEYEAARIESDVLKKTLEDILNTPVSPELLPPENGEIAQKTEQFVGPYLLHDFFLYYMMRFAFSPSKIYHIAKIAFKNEFSSDEILKWMKVFYRRFFSQQFKRSCIPDGPKVGSVSLSPRGDLRMPSDACAVVWLEDLKNIQ